MYRAALRGMPPRMAAPTVAALAAAVLALAALAIAGCGSDPAPRPGPRVTLKLTAPADGSRISAGTATVSGTVAPARARVDVLGRRVTVAPDGRFSTQIGLAVGTNLIDVIASAPRSVGAVTAVRIVRFLLVSVPQVVGLGPSQATAALKALGLAVTVVGSSDPLGFLIPGSTSVCYSTPAAGTKVNPGTTVTIKTSKLCGL